MNKRFIIIVLDSFGIGAMDDVERVRPEDIGTNTCLHLLQYPKEKKWDNLVKMGLMNALGHDYGKYKKAKTAIFGKSKLKHYGADSYYGHQEMSGTNPRKPIFTKIQKHLEDIEEDLINHGYEVERVEKDGLELLKVDNMICIGDNMETDLGQAINVVGALDVAGFDKIKDVGKLVRKHVKVPRVIAFGGSNVTIEDILDNVITKEGEFIGIDAPGSGVYKENYHVVHLGYGVDPKKQVPTALAKIGIKNYFYGKVENIVYNPNGKNFPCVDSADTLDELIKDLKKENEGFYFLNIQETDLSGHANDPERYIDVVNVCDEKIGEILDLLTDDDILIVTADHGNDPTIEHSKHTRENVPILIRSRVKNKLINIGNRDTLADIGQTVAEYFNTKIEFGTSFLSKIL